MKRYLKFLFLALAFAALPGEVMLQIFTLNSPSGFFTSMATYVVILSLLYLLHKRNEIPSAPPYKKRLKLFFVFGFFGLMFEWFALGQAPWINPDASQIGMFTFWATLYIAPVMLLEQPRFPRVNKKFLWFYVPWAVIILVLASQKRHSETLYFIALILITFSIWLLNIFYFKYFRALKRQQQELSAPQPV
jgi:hypothetical protein